VDYTMTGVAALTVVVVLVPLFAIFAYLVYKGIGSINIAFLTRCQQESDQPACTFTTDMDFGAETTMTTP